MLDVTVDLQSSLIIIVRKRGVKIFVQDLNDVWGSSSRSLFPLNFSFVLYIENSISASGCGKRWKHIRKWGCFCHTTAYCINYYYLCIPNRTIKLLPHAAPHILFQIMWPPFFSPKNFPYIVPMVPIEKYNFQNGSCKLKENDNSWTDRYFMLNFPFICLISCSEYRRWLDCESFCEISHVSFFNLLYKH